MGTLMHYFGHNLISIFMNIRRFSFNHEARVAQLASA